MLGPDIFDPRRAGEITELAGDPQKLQARALKIQTKLELKAEKLAEEKKEAPKPAAAAAPKPAEPPNV